MQGYLGQNIGLAKKYVSSPIVIKIFLLFTFLNIGLFLINLIEMFATLNTNSSILVQVMNSTFFHALIEDIVPLYLLNIVIFSTIWIIYGTRLYSSISRSKFELLIILSLTFGWILFEYFIELHDSIMIYLKYALLSPLNILFCASIGTWRMRKILPYNPKMPYWGGNSQAGVWHFVCLGILVLSLALITYSRNFGLVAIFSLCIMTSFTSFLALVCSLILLIGGTAVGGPIPGILAIIIAICFFVSKLEFIGKHWRGLCVGAVVYSFFCYYTYEFGGNKDLIYITNLNPLKVFLFKGLEAPLMMGLITHFLLLWLYRWGYTTKTAWTVIGGLPVTCISLLLPFISYAINHIESPVNTNLSPNNFDRSNQYYDQGPYINVDSSDYQVSTNYDSTNITNSNPEMNPVPMPAPAGFSYNDSSTTTEIIHPNDVMHHPTRIIGNNGFTHTIVDQVSPDHAVVQDGMNHNIGTITQIPITHDTIFDINGEKVRLAENGSLLNSQEMQIGSLKDDGNGHRILLDINGKTIYRISPTGSILDASNKTVGHIK